MTWRSPGAEIRCIAPARKPRFKGEQCRKWVTRVPDGYRFAVLGLVAHSSLAEPSSFLAPCSRCGHLHEIRIEAVAAELPKAA